MHGLGADSKGAGAAPGIKGQTKPSPAPPRPHLVLHKEVNTGLLTMSMSPSLLLRPHQPALSG